MWQEQTFFYNGFASVKSNWLSAGNSDCTESKLNSVKHLDKYHEKDSP